MKVYTILILLVLVSIGFQSCNLYNGKGPIVSESRKVRDYKQVDVFINATINITQAVEFSVEVLAQPNIQDEILVTAAGSTLTIKQKRDVTLQCKPIVVNISMPDVAVLNLFSSGRIRIQKGVKTPKIQMDVSSSGSIFISSLTADMAEVDVSGSGNIEVESGQVEALFTIVSGSGKIDMMNVVSTTCNSGISGAGTTKINVKEELEAGVAGTGHIYYKGNPTLNTTIGGSGEIHHVTD